MKWPCIRHDEVPTFVLCQGGHHSLMGLVFSRPTFQRCSPHLQPIYVVTFAFLFSPQGLDLDGSNSDDWLWKWRISHHARLPQYNIWMTFDLFYQYCRRKRPSLTLEIQLYDTVKLLIYFLIFSRYTREVWVVLLHRIKHVMFGQLNFKNL